MLSETMISSVLGYIAEMLYNPNNGTPGAVRVTVDREIEACGEMLRMFGYSSSPSCRRLTRSRRNTMDAKNSR